MRKLKDAQRCTLQEIADSTEIPLGTVGRYLSNIDDDSANFEYVCKIVEYMGGSLDELAGFDNKAAAPAYPSIGDIRAEIDHIAREAIREVYESTALKSIHNNMVWWRWFALAEAAFILGILIWDIFHPTAGYIRYTTSMVPDLYVLIRHLQL